MPRARMRRALPAEDSMPELNKVVVFVMTNKPEQATAFYRDTLGFKLLNDDGFALVFDAHGTMLRVVKAK